MKSWSPPWRIGAINGEFLSRVSGQGVFLGGPAARGAAWQVDSCSRMSFVRSFHVGNHSVVYFSSFCGSRYPGHRQICQLKSSSYLGGWGSGESVARPTELRIFRIEDGSRIHAIRCIRESQRGHRNTSTWNTLAKRSAQRRRCRRCVGSVLSS